jgi:hypothetical protein
MPGTRQGCAFPPCSIARLLSCLEASWDNLVSDDDDPADDGRLDHEGSFSRAFGILYTLARKIEQHDPDQDRQ